jgi:excisionase family DNA binding protein
MERGYAVAVTSVDADLTTQQAADVLNVSRPYLVRLLEQGQIPFHKTGSHRRVRHRDLMAYKRQVDAQRLQVLDALTAQAQELGLGY